MIAVLADDFTGAAELAGICLRYGLKVRVYTGEVNDPDADVIILSTDSRSLSPADAITITRLRVQELLRLKPDFIYKKTDSVLRGYVAEELAVQLQEEGKSRVILLPANPSLGRTIRNGVYYINDVPISQTDFSNDPEFPVSDAAVTRMINCETATVSKPGDFLPQQGIVIAEAASSADITEWVKAKDEKTILAGAGDFFTAILDQLYNKVEYESPSVQKPFLYVCGTAYAPSVAFVKKSEPDGLVAYISKSSLEHPEVLDQPWVYEAGQMMKEEGILILAIDGPSLPAGITPAELRRSTAKSTQWIIRRNIIHELFVEGGSTATAVLAELGVHMLEPVAEWQRGVVRMKAENLFITVKPGSYALPEKIKELFN